MYTLFFKAIEFATLHHASQKRKGTEMPYIMHPLSVALYLQKLNCVENIILGGLFHDLLEDTNVSAQEIIEQFGESVFAIVEACTDPKHLPWRERKEFVLEKYSRASYEVRMVSLCDKLHNLYAINTDFKNDSKLFDTGKFKGYRDNYVWYYSSIYSVFELFDEPDFVVLKNDYLVELQLFLKNLNVLKITSNSEV